MLMIYKNSIVQFYSENHKNIFFIVILQRFNIKEAGLKPCFFYVTLSPRRKCELPVPEVTRLRTLSCGKPKFNESEQSLIRRYAPYKSSHSDHIRAIKKILPAKSPILSDFFHTQKPKFERQKS